MILTVIQAFLTLPEVGTPLAYISPHYNVLTSILFNECKLHRYAVTIFADVAVLLRKQGRIFW